MSSALRHLVVAQMRSQYEIEGNRAGVTGSWGNCRSISPDQFLHFRRFVLLTPR